MDLGFTQKELQDLGRWIASDSATPIERIRRRRGTYAEEFAIEKGSKVA